jgi:hypothetical protein
MLSTTQLPATPLTAGPRAAPRKPETALIVRAATYWAALAVANAACLGLMAMLLFR